MGPNCPPQHGRKPCWDPGARSPSSGTRAGAGAGACRGKPGLGWLRTWSCRDVQGPSLRATSALQLCSHYHNQDNKFLLLRKFPRAPFDQAPPPCKSNQWCASSVCNFPVLKFHVNRILTCVLSAHISFTHHVLRVNHVVFINISSSFM